jgi:hypothetical protein
MRKKSSKQDTISGQPHLMTLLSLKMPTTRPRPSDQSLPKLSAESIRTGIVVSAVVGVLATIITAYVIMKQRLKRGVKAGTRIDRLRNVGDVRREKEDRDLEVGIIREPLPVYQKEQMEIEPKWVGATRGEAQR